MHSLRQGITMTENKTIISGLDSLPSAELKNTVESQTLQPHLKLVESPSYMLQNDCVDS